MMMLLIVISILWAIRIISNILSFAYLWYIKEYRFDRMWIHIKTEGVMPLILPSLRRPPFRRPKAFFLVSASIAVLGVLYVFLPFIPLVKILMVDLLTFPVVSMLVFIFKLPTALYHEFVLYQATRKLHAHKPMIVIGITGSIGKSSTKEFLSTILQSKFHVLKTTGSQNAAIGVAEVILRELEPEHEIFIVEMGAYKKGEIAKIARLVEPQIGIVTTVNEQHVDLFGTLENTMMAKYELVGSLKGKSIAIFNADNAFTRRMATQAHKEGKQVWMYTKEHMKFDVAQKMFQAQQIKSDLNNLTFFISTDNQKEKITVSLSGEHQVSTVLAAVAGAVACGMNFTEAIEGARLIGPFRKTMQSLSGVGGSLFIDDTFNNNPEAAKAALTFLSKVKGKKFLVFQPMIELGSYAQKDHEEVGEVAGKVCDEIILTNDTFSQYFIQGVQSSGFDKDVHIFSAKEAAVFISSHVKKNDIVLFKGKEAGRVLNLLI